MFALTLIAIVLCTITLIFPNLMAVFMGNDEDKVFGAFNLVPLVFCIIVLSIWLARA